MTTDLTTPTLATTLAACRLATVSVAFLRRLPMTSIVGLPASTVKETSERVRAAIEGAGFEYPRTRIVVEVKHAAKRAPQTVELAIALAILAHSGQVRPLPADALLVGELPYDETGIAVLREAIATLGLA